MMEQSTNEQKCIDLLNRQPFIDRLKYIADLLSRGKKNACYAINGEWGSGKSFVLDMFEKEISEIKTDDGSDYRYMLFHYNCWQYDYYEEPLLSIVSVLLDTIEKDKHNLISDDNKIKLKNIAKELAVPAISLVGSILKYTTGTNPAGLLKAISSLGLRLHKKAGTEDNETAISDFLQAVSSANDSAQKSIDDAHDYDPYYHFKKVINELRSTISSIAEERTILLVVDELDRCLPEYAIKVLERLHHVFDDVKNVQVVLAVDKVQLGNTIQRIFGENASVKQYLDKFIDFELKLSTGESTNFVKNTCPEYFACFTNAHMKADKIDFFISFLFNGLDMRSRRLITEKSFLCHRMLNNYEQPMSTSRLCVELLLSLLCHFQFSIRESKTSFDYKDIFHSIILKEPKGYNSGLTNLSLIYSEQRKTKYLYSDCGVTYINTKDVWGYILGCYRHILGFRDDVWINVPPTEYKEFDKELETNYFSDFWRFIQTIS